MINIIYIYIDIYCIEYLLYCVQKFLLINFFINCGPIIYAIMGIGFWGLIPNYEFESF